MPYIKPELRDEVDLAIDDLVEFLTTYKKTSPDGVKGVVNYIVTRIVSEAFLPLNYASGSDMIATLECSKFEIYRRLLSDYEDAASLKNGDLSSFL